MEEILIENGFCFDKIAEEWTRGPWTIRFDDIGIEVYDDPEQSPHKVYIGNKIANVNLKHIIDEIDCMIASEK